MIVVGIGLVATTVAYFSENWGNFKKSRQRQKNNESDEITLERVQGLKKSISSKHDVRALHAWLWISISMIFIFILLMALGISLVEGWSYLLAIYFVVETMTTVGWGKNYLTNKFFGHCEMWEYILYIDLQKWTFWIKVMSKYRIRLCQNLKFRFWKKIKIGLRENEKSGHQNQNFDV